MTGDPPPETWTDVLLVGAGPIGIETAIRLKQAGVDTVHVEKGAIASTIGWFPEQMTFFSSTDRIALADVPIQTVGQTKCTKEQYLAYLRSLVLAFDLEIRAYEEVVDVERAPEGVGFVVRTRRATGEHVIRARRLVLATGDTARPRRLGVEGEDLPHVHHAFREPHRYFQQRLLVVGGRNSAVEAALRCWHAGAEVALSYRRAAFDPNHVKYWLLPELEGRIERGEMVAWMETMPVAFRPGVTTLSRPDGSTVDVPSDFVLLLIGFEADQRLFEAAGVPLDGDERVPRHDPRTMETAAPGVYVAGTAVAGTQSSYRVFLENCHVHAERIVAALTGAPPPETPSPRTRPES